MNELHGRILTPSGLVRGTIRFGERIEEIEAANVDGPLLLPGFVDVHVHGGGGADTMDGAEGVRDLARFHLSHGTTTLLPTTMTNPWPEVTRALRGVAEARDGGGDDLPDIPGAHLEGPFISPDRLGAQPPFATNPTPELVEEVIAGGGLKVVTLAPELPGALEAAGAFARAGIRVSIGHTRADYNEVLAVAHTVWAEGGSLGFTHLYNAMGGISGREPGVAGAALALRGAWAELIYDRQHVAPGAMLAAHAAKGGRLLFVTDAMRAAGLAEGESELGGQRVIVKQGAARLAEGGALAGSVLTLDRALCNALAAGIQLPRASALVSAAPARYLGLADRGELAVGKRADIVELGDDYNVEQVFVAGGKAAPAEASRA